MSDVLEEKPAAAKKRAAGPKAEGAKVRAPKPEGNKARKQAAAASSEEGDATAAGHLRIKGLVDRVIAATDQNRKEVKIIVEATLAELAKALVAGEALSLPPLGKVRIANQSTEDGSTSMRLKVRAVGEKHEGKKADKEAIAEASEAS